MKVNGSEKCEIEFMNKPYIKLICIILKYLTYKEYLNIYTHYQYHTVLLFALNFTVVQLIISPFVYYV